MRNKILNTTNDPNFILNQHGINFYVQFETLDTALKYKTFKGLTGLYILYDDLIDVCWYIGQSCSPGVTNTGGIDSRLRKHLDRALGTINLKHHKPMPSWHQFNQWITTHQYPHRSNTEVAAIIISSPQKQTIDDAELQLIQYSRNLYPYLNAETYHHSRLSNLAPTVGGIALPIPTLMTLLG